MNRYLVASFGILVVLLVIGAHFGFAWAGGPGYEAKVKASVTHTEGAVTVDRHGIERTPVAHTPFQRGEIIRTSEDGRAIIQIGFGNQIYLDHRTDVRLDDLNEANPAITLLRGRIVVDTHTDRPRTTVQEGLRVQSLHTTASLPYGKASFVNYDFLETFSIYPYPNTIVAAVTPDGTGSLIPNAIEIHETDPVTITDMVFDPTGGSAADFYSWVN